MYWGDPDASVNFCEDKYKVLPYVAEYYNTMSAISYLIVGIILRNFTKLKKISNSILFLGVGTMLLHGTLRRYGQWVDECGMLSFSYDVIVEFRRRRNKTTNNLYFVFLIGTYFLLVKFHFFVLLFLGLQLYIFFLSNKSYKNTREKLLIQAYGIVFIVSMVLWFLDQFYCSYTKNYQLHALWHVGTSISILLGCLTLI
jgi:hypothetical protein